MNLRKLFVLSLLIVIPVCISSQQYYSLLSLMINDVGDAVPDIYENFFTEKDGIVYDNTGIPCEGFQTDYYDKEKSKVRITGHFKKGLPTEMVKGFYESGVIKFRYTPYNKKYKYYGRRYNYSLFREYDENGICRRYTDDIKGIEKKYNSYGCLISVMNYSRKRSKLINYEGYSAGNIKITAITGGNKYDYDESGRVRRYWERKSEKYDKKSGTLAATFYIEEYDVTGDISRTGRFYTDLYEYDQLLHIPPEYPESIESIPLQDFKEITNHQLGIKDVYKWDYANNKTIIITDRKSTRLNSSH